MQQQQLSLLKRGLRFEIDRCLTVGRERKFAVFLVKKDHRDAWLAQAGSGAQIAVCLRVVVISIGHVLNQGIQKAGGLGKCTLTRQAFVFSFFVL